MALDSEYETSAHRFDVYPVADAEENVRRAVVGQLPINVEICQSAPVTSFHKVLRLSW